MLFVKVSNNIFITYIILSHFLWKKYSDLLSSFHIYLELISPANYYKRSYCSSLSIFFKTVIKMSAKYGENEWKTRDGNFKMRKKFFPPPPPKKNKNAILAKEKDRNFSTHTVNDEKFHRRDSPTRSRGRVRPNYLRKRKVRVEGINRCLLTKLPIRSRTADSRAACKLLDLFNFSQRRYLTSLFRFIIPLARCIDLDNGRERTLV